MTTIDPDQSYSQTRLDEAREAVEKQCILFKYEIPEDQLRDAAWLLRAWWSHADDYQIPHWTAAMQGGLPWVAVACIRSRAAS